MLETAEDRAAKEERTRQLIAAYKKKVGLNIDAKLKSECEKVLSLKNSTFADTMSSFGFFQL